MIADDLVQCWQKLATLQTIEDPALYLIGQEGFHYTSTSRAIYGPGYYGHRVRWHPQLPLLCLFDEATWRLTNGAIAYNFGRGQGLWHSNGFCFLYEDHSGGLNWYDFHTMTHVQQPQISIGSSSLHPINTLVVARQRTEARRYILVIWNPQTDQLLPVESSDGAFSNEFQWSPDGGYFAGVGSDDTGTWIGLWQADGSLIVKHRLPSDAVLSSYFLESTLAWSADSRTLIIHGNHTLIWWDIQHPTYRTISISTGAIETGFCGVLWHPTQPYALVQADASLLVLDSVGNIHQRLPIPHSICSATMAWHPIKPYIMMGAWNCDIVLWSLDGQVVDQRNILADTPEAPMQPIQLPYYSGFHPRGDWLAITTRSYFIHLYHVSLIP